MRKAQTGQYGGEYQRRAKAVRDAAVACHLCGEGKKENDPFEADHLVPAERGDSAILLPAHRSCNRARGNKPLPPTPKAPYRPPVASPPAAVPRDGSDC